MSSATVEAPKAEVVKPEISPEVRNWIVDQVYATARKGNFCRTTEITKCLNAVLGKPAEGTEHRDSNGLTCDGRDAEGFKDGFDINGYDREGYGTDGYHRNTGRDRDGFDYRGVNEAGLSRAQWAKTPEGKAFEAKKLVASLVETGAIAGIAAAVAEHLRTPASADTPAA